MGTTNEDLKEILLKLTSKVDEFERINVKIISDVEVNKKGIEELKSDSKETKEKLEKEIDYLKK